MRILNKIKYYGFLGEPCYDFVIYLADILYCFDIKVLVADYSKSKSVLKCIPTPKRQMEFIHYGGIDYLGECFLRESQISKFQIIFIVLPEEQSENISFWTEKSRIEIKWDKLYAFTDFSKKSFENISNQIKKANYDVHMIYRDCFSKKISNQYFKQIYMEGCDAIKSEFIINLDEYDYASRIILEYESVNGIQKISEDFKTCLFSKASEILEMPYNIVKKEYWRKKRRKI